MRPETALGRAAYDDILALPDNVVGEIVYGVLEVSPRPAPPHAVAAGGLTGFLEPPFQWRRGGPGGWWILYEPEIHLGEHVLVPDLGGWRRERMPKLPETAFFPLAPDWVCEVVSPGSARLDRVRKLPAYAEQGVAWAWLVDPLARSLEVFRLRDGAWVLHSTHEDADLVRADPFAAVEIDLLLLWGEEREAPEPAP